jgi:hypothetical protein
MLSIFQTDKGKICGGNISIYINGPLWHDNNNKSDKKAIERMVIKYEYDLNFCVGMFITALAIKLHRNIKS